MPSRNLHSVPSAVERRQHKVQRLEGLLSDNHGVDCRSPKRADGQWRCDPYWGEHGLAWWYPQIVEWVGVRTSSGRSGAGGTVAIPIDVDALCFVDGQYWVGEGPPTADTVDDPEYYQPGFVLTVLGMEQSARVALGLRVRPRPRAEGYDGLSADPRIPAALEWLAAHAANLVDDAPHVAEMLRSEALRLIGRAAAMLYGSRFEASTNPCMHCGSEDTVVADEDRAVCINPDCRDANGLRHCWRKVDEAWTAVEEPDLPNRDRVTDEQLLRWGAGG